MKARIIKWLLPYLLEELVTKLPELLDWVVNWLSDFSKDTSNTFDDRAVKSLEKNKAAIARKATDTVKANKNKILNEINS